MSDYTPPAPGWLARLPVKKRTSFQMGLAVLGLFVFLWVLSADLAPLPKPIGPAAQQFADGARTTVMLTLVSGLLGGALGIGLGLGKLSAVKALLKV